MTLSDKDAKITQRFNNIKQFLNYSFEQYSAEIITKGTSEESKSRYIASFELSVNAIQSDMGILARDSLDPDLTEDERHGKLIDTLNSIHKKIGDMIGLSVPEEQAFLDFHKYSNTFWLSVDEKVRNLAFNLDPNESEAMKNIFSQEYNNVIAQFQTLQKPKTNLMVINRS